MELHPLIDPCTTTITVASSTSAGKDTADYVCDGTADNVQIQAAVDSLSGAGVVQLLEGTFTYAAKTDIYHDDDGICIKGMGKGVTIIDGALADGVPFIELHADTGETLSHVRLSEFTIDATDHHTNAGVLGMISHQEAGAIEYLEISNVEINTANNLNSGIMFFNAVGTNKYIRILNTDITSTAGLVYGIGIFKNTENLWIENNYVSVSSSGAYNGIAVYGGSKYFHVSNNIVIGGGHTPIAVSPGQYGEIISNVVDGSGVAAEGGIEVEWKAGHYGTDTSHHIVVSGNIVFNANWGIYTHRRDTGDIAPHDITITGNSVSACTIGINIVSGTDITVYGNDYENNETDFSKETGTTVKALEVESNLNVDDTLTATTITDGTATLTGDTLTATTITDGTATITGGDFSGVDVTASGTLTSDDLTGIYTAEYLGDVEKVNSAALTEGNPHWTYGGDWVDSVPVEDAANHKETAWTGTDDLTADMITAVEDGVKYTVTATFSALTVTGSGGVTVSLGGVDKTNAANGENSWDITATNTNGLVINVSGENITTNIILDEVSVKAFVPASVTDIEIGPAVSGVTSDTYINPDGGDIFLVGDTRIGGDANSTSFDVNGVQTMAGDARVNRHIWVNATSMKKDGAADGTDGIGSHVIFRAGQTDEVRYSAHVPYRWDDDTDILFELLWYYNDGNEDVDVRWNCSYKSIAHTGEDPGGAGTALAEQAVSIATQRSVDHLTFTVPKAALAVHDTLEVRIWRDGGTDTFSQSALLSGVHIHFVMDKLGEATGE